MKNASVMHRARLFVKSKLTCALLALIAPLAALAQQTQTVFNDTFVNGSTVGLTSIPGGTPTASSTSYDFAASKSISSLAAIGTAVTNGQLNIGMIGTSASYMEGSAVFSATPITLAVPGDTIDIQQVFTATTNLFTTPSFGK